MRPFFHRAGVTFVVGDHVHFVGLDLAAKRRRRLLALAACAQLLRHALGLVLVEPQLLSDLAIGQVQAHEIQAQHPGAQRLMVTRKDRPSQIIEPAPAVGAAVLLPLGLCRIPPLLADRRRVAVDAAHACGPTQGADGLETFGVVDEVPDVEHAADSLVTSKGPALYPLSPSRAASTGVHHSPLRELSGMQIEPKLFIE